MALEAARIQGFCSGGTTVAPSADQVLAVMVVCFPAQIRAVFCATTGGGGGQQTATIIDVRKNGVSMYTNPSHRPTLPPGQTGVFVTYPPDNRSLNRGDVLTLVCAQAGVNAPVAATAAIEEP